MKFILLTPVFNQNGSENISQNSLHHVAVANFNYSDDAKF